MNGIPNLSKRNCATDIEGFTSVNPVPDEDWDDFVRWELNLRWSERHGHNLDGFMAHPAGTDQCESLGHKPDPDGEWDSTDHPDDWNGEPLCVATRFSRACTECESDECIATPTNTANFWKKFEAHNV